jgi:hypothetical protein
MRIRRVETRLAPIRKDTEADRLVRRHAVEKGTRSRHARVRGGRQAQIESEYCSSSAVGRNARGSVFGAKDGKLDHPVGGAAVTIRDVPEMVVNGKCRWCSGEEVGVVGKRWVKVEQEE